MKDDGGPAFPRDHRYEGHNGMTLRDYFAAKAMSDVLGHFSWLDGDIAHAAAMAYRLADAMLAERSL